MKRSKRTRFILLVLVLIVALVILNIGNLRSFLWSPKYSWGERIDSLNGVYVHYNGAIGTVNGRSYEDGYNLGLNYQCVEFVKRYYLRYFNHKMPDTWGHAKDFFISGLESGELNKQRNLLQFTNGGATQPQDGDLLIWGPSFFNEYGHVAIISKASKDAIEIIQQNPGPTSASREQIGLVYKGGKWEIKDDNILGWLRKSE